MIPYNKKAVKKVEQKDIKRFLSEVEHKLDFPNYYYGDELNTYHKDWSDDSIVKGLFVNPVVYDAGINGLGVNILYQLVNELDHTVPTFKHLKEVFKLGDIPDQMAERAYMPDKRLFNYLKQEEYPVIFGVESKQPWNKYDWLGISMYFELQFFNMVGMMYHSGIPLYTTERTALPSNNVTSEQEREYPVIAIGGISAYCSEGVAECYDIAFIGDGEAQLPKFCELMSLYKQHKISSKLGLLKRCVKEIPGCYVPMFYKWEHKMGERMPLSYSVLPEYKDVAPEVVTKALFDITKLPPFYKQLLPQCAENLLGYANIEVNRGCHNFCRFCKASACHKPVREHSIDAILESVKEAPKYEGAQNITPYSLNYTGFSQKNLLAYRAVNESQKGFTTSTQRVDTFSPALAQALHELGDKGSTFAFESGSQRMRNIINKEITEEQILYAVYRTIDIGYSSMKFYMISCLPWERDEDRFEIVRIMTKIVNYYKSKGKHVRIRISFTPFTSCPQTALQWADCSDWDDKLEPVYTELRKIDVFDQRSISGNNHFLLQLSNRMDRRFNDIVVESVINYDIMYNDRHIKKGYDLEGLFDQLCMKYTGVHAIDFLKEIPIDAVLPWDIMSNGVSKEWLKKEYLKAKEIGLTHKYIATPTELHKQGIQSERGLLTEEGNPKMWVNTNIKVIPKEDMPENFLPLDAGLTPSCMKTCNKCGVCQNDCIKAQGGKIATYHLRLKDMPEQELIDRLMKPEKDIGYMKILIEFSIAPQVRYIPQTKFKLLLKSAFAFAGVPIREKMEILSESIPFDNIVYGKDLAMMRTNGLLSRITKEQLDIINGRLNGELKVTRVKVYRPDSLSGLKQLQDYILYYVPMRLYSQDIVDKLNCDNQKITLTQRKRGDKQGRSVYRDVETEIYFARAVPIQLDSNNKPVGNAYRVYFALEPSISPYDMLKSLMGIKNKRELFKYPIEKKELIRVPTKASIFNKKCTCGRFKETDITGRPLSKKCIRCTIQDNIIRASDTSSKLQPVV